MGATSSKLPNGHITLVGISTTDDFFTESLAEIGD